MAVSTKTTLFISFLLLVCIFSVDGGRNGVARHVYSPHKDGFRLHARKLSLLDAVLDYDDAGANPKHDPRRGRGGRNP
ncbi:hypothetical protein HanRHA438_Chr04g0175941 [Helianthus annuus]|uniref:Uncharacterized protein n=1 Tax=Helianthus annuus TaxID=4232 RepID=A0A251TR96_HELAN|nr:uncharacterized protein LOC110877024 [Helianthus annuus]KAF5810174.1 hypothetical protein HanXRQr2_Chr04g0166311 [Helianthus annuus]KAJ0926840.1 hypothetical protein HanRHA438_Chr04g0175941 [Helianthus annuus]KAJ0931296.1 hypothetical protein HanPSC8_Chr04g0159971 [Helianthus annuus]